MPDRLAVQKEYDEFFRLKPNHWHNLDRSNFMIRVLDEYIPNPTTLVDVGCGNGITLENYSHSKPMVKLYGIDPSNEGIRLSKLRVPDGIFTTEEQFDDIKKFDVVTCLGVAEHVEDLEAFLKYLKEMVSGYCYFEVPHNLVYSKGPETYRRLTVGSKQIEWHYQRSKWEELLLEAGFKIIAPYDGLNVTWEFIWVLR